MDPEQKAAKGCLWGATLAMALYILAFAVYALLRKYG